MITYRKNVWPFLFYLKLFLGDTSTQAASWSKLESEFMQEREKAARSQPQVGDEQPSVFIFKLPLLRRES